MSGKDLAGEIKKLPQDQKDTLFKEILRSLKIDLTKFDCSINGGFPLRMLNARVLRFLTRKVTFIRDLKSARPRATPEDLN